MKPVKAWFSYYAGSSGAANTAFASGFQLTPNQDSSWSSWQAVFDEFRVIEAELIWNTYYTVDPTALPTNSSNSIAVYDPTNTVTLTSVNAGFQFEHYTLCRNMIPTSSGPKVSPMVQTKDGFNHFRVKIPSGVINSNIDVANTGSNQWRPTADATTYNWGAFTCYTSQGGSTSVLRLEGFVRMLVELRVRR